MSFAMLAVVGLAALLGPLLALPERRHIPVVVGELVAGVLLGPTLAGYLRPSDPTFTLLADIGFALVMFVAGSHVPVRDPRLPAGLRAGCTRACVVGIVSVPAALLLSHLFGTGHSALYTVLLASSSAALIIPITQQLKLGGTSVLELLPQVAVADTACIVAVPLTVDPAHAGRAALGALAVVGVAVAFFILLRHIERSGLRRRVHRVSEQREFALELRVSLIALFALAALATATHVSIMLAGFCLGLAVAAVGEPRRLTRQLFAVTEGFFGPLFFVWLGAQLDLRQLGHRPDFILLGLALGVGAIATHAAAYFTRQPVPLGVLAASQLGVPVAAATLGTQTHSLAPGEAPALMLGALVTIGAAAVAAPALARVAPLDPVADGSTGE